MNTASRRIYYLIPMRALPGGRYEMVGRVRSDRRSVEHGIQTFSIDHGNVTMMPHEILREHGIAVLDFDYTNPTGRYLQVHDYDFDDALKALRSYGGSDEHGTRNSAGKKYRPPIWMHERWAVETPIQAENYSMERLREMAANGSLTKDGWVRIYATKTKKQAEADAAAWSRGGGGRTRVVPGPGHASIRDANRASKRKGQRRAARLGARRGMREPLPAWDMTLSDAPIDKQYEYLREVLGYGHEEAVREIMERSGLPGSRIDVAVANAQDRIQRRVVAHASDAVDPRSSRDYSAHIVDHLVRMGVKKAEARKRVRYYRGEIEGRWLPEGVSAEHAAERIRERVRAYAASSRSA